MSADDTPGEDPPGDDTASEPTADADRGTEGATPPDVPGDSGGEQIAGAERDEEESIGGLSRRTIIRLLVGLGIGIPLLVEMATFFGLVRQSFGGGSDSEGDGDGTGGPTATPQPEGVGPGDELLPETPPADTVRTADIRAESDAWRLTISVEVENDTDRAYVLQLGAVTTTGGDIVQGDQPIVRVEAGDAGTVTGEWALPPGERPAELVARTSLGGGETTEHRVPMASLSVRGQ
jgi:hypothetical protein